MDVDKSSKQADRQACRQAGPRQTGRKEGRQAVSLVSNTAVAAGSNSSNTAVAANFRFSNSTTKSIAFTFYVQKCHTRDVLVFGQTGLDSVDPDQTILE